tara:strand:+ start:1896 stop:3902 length:2007 start_codon:yes stop_codon:yes gene_type:complete
MAGIDNLIQERVDTFSSNPEMLEQRYGQNQDLIDLLALQRLKSEKDSAARQMQMQMAQTPSTVKQQLEQELTQRTLQDAQQQVGAGMQREAGQQKQAMAQMAQQSAKPSPPPGIAGATQRYADGGQVTNKRSLEDVAASGETPEYWAEMLMRPELTEPAKKIMKESMDAELLQAVTAAGFEQNLRKQGLSEEVVQGKLQEYQGREDTMQGIKSIPASIANAMAESPGLMPGNPYEGLQNRRKPGPGPEVAKPVVDQDPRNEGLPRAKTSGLGQGENLTVDPTAGLPAIKPGVKAGVNSGGIPNLLAKPAPAPAPAPTTTTNTTSLSSAMSQAPETNITAPKLQSLADSAGIAGQVMGEQGMEKPLNREESAAEGKRIYQQTNDRLRRDEAFNYKKQAIEKYRALLEDQQDPDKQRWGRFMSYMLGGAGHTSGSGALAGAARAQMETAAGQKQFAIDAARSLFKDTSELYDSDAELGKASIAEETATLNRLSGDMRNWQSTFASLTGAVQTRANKEADLKFDADVANQSNAMEKFSIEIRSEIAAAKLSADMDLETLKNKRADVLAFGKAIEGITTWVTGLETEILATDRTYQNLLKDPQADPALIAQREKMAKGLAAAKAGPETRKTINLWMDIMEKLGNNLSNLDPNATDDDKANIANKYMPQGYGI